MSVTVNWGTPEQTIIFYNFVDPWTWGETQAALDQGNTLLEEAKQKYGPERKIHVFMDFTKTRHLPGGAITEVRRAFTTKPHPSIGITCFIGANPLIQNIAELGSKVVRSASMWNYKFVPSQEAAWNVIREASPQSMPAQPVAAPASSPASATETQEAKPVPVQAAPAAQPAPTQSASTPAATATPAPAANPPAASQPTPSEPPAKDAAAQ